eukprot:TRINITY_DN7926_c0_g1_i2.p1 TRINITY_DN7926_c0_g1~~TRINITY_DN7926_c0_g1_i2.p1  ORF type:complete len:565 (+),score=240.23 TRINITY_DN7926_c0_g1_i2:103-1797(+)
MSEVKVIPTTPFKDQKPGTSGLRKKVKVFSTGFYLHNFVQSLFNTLPASELKGATLVVGGDGRYWNNEALQIIIQLSAGNGVAKLLIGQNGILSTPAVSAVVRARKAYGAIILTASHNPGGEHNDFGIKYNTGNGGPAPESITNAIYAESLKISQLRLVDVPHVDLSKVGPAGSWTVSSGGVSSQFAVEVIDSVADYLALMKSIFDFDSLKKLMARPDFKFTSDSLNGVTGPYCTRIFAEELGADPAAIKGCVPMPDFGGHHPDPNLTYAPELVKLMYSGQYELGCAFDGDGDRNMVLGNKFFVNPSDSLAIIAANADSIPYFRGKLKGVSRSMPTGSAIDRVAQRLGLEFFEVPTGWKFFGNLMDAGRIQICGEESFGTGSDHIREKDGLWAVLAWLSIVAHYNSDPSKPLVTVAEIARQHWTKYGRNFFTRHDFEEVDSDAANKMMAHLNTVISDPAVKGRKVGNYEIASADDFEYTDPIDGSVSKNQGIRFVFTDGSRLVFRLSGTGSSGATIRVYIDMYEPHTARHDRDTQDALKEFIAIGHEISQLRAFTGRNAPTVIT